MPRLAIFCHSLYGGGAEKAMLNLACGFSRLGIDVDLVLLRVEGPYLSQLPPEVRTIDLGGRRLLFSLNALRRYLRQEQPQAFLSTLDDTNIAALWARRLSGKEIRIVVNVQNTISQDAKNATQLKTRLMPQLVRWFFPWADAVVTVSQGVAEDLFRIGVASDRIQVIHNPVVTPELFLQAQALLEHPWFASGQPPVILGVGRLEKQKDFPTLIRAFSQVRQHHLARLMILGEGNERSHLESLVQELNLTADVSLPGFVANPYAYMSRAAVFVLSSLFEGLPTVLIEAIAVGTPVVATDCQSGPAEILANGQYGKLVAIGNIQQLSQAIIETLATTPDSEALQQRASEYSLAKALSQYQQILQLN